MSNLRNSGSDSVFRIACPTVVQNAISDPGTFLVVLIDRLPLVEFDDSAPRATDLVRRTNLTTRNQRFIRHVRDDKSKRPFGTLANQIFLLDVRILSLLFGVDRDVMNHPSDSFYTVSFVGGRTIYLSMYKRVSFQPSFHSEY